MTPLLFIIIVLVVIAALRIAPQIGFILLSLLLIGIIVGLWSSAGSWWSHHVGAQSHIHVTYREVPGEDNQSFVVHIDNQSDKTIRNFRMTCTNGPTMTLDDIGPHSRYDGTLRFSDILPHHACSPDYHVVRPDSQD
jgi:hypothetical protein